MDLGRIFGSVFVGGRLVIVWGGTDVPAILSCGCKKTEKLLLVPGMSARIGIELFAFVTDMS